MVATDRDLLQHEPRLFNDVRWAGQTLFEGSGTLNAAGDRVTIAGFDATARGIGVGCVALLDGLAVEIVDVATPGSLGVSLLRSRRGDSVIGVTGGPRSVGVVVATFRPQIALVHDRILRALGLATLDDEPGQFGEAAITNPGSLVRIEALGALHAVFASASALVEANSPMWARAQMYRERFIEERRRVRMEIDLDGDGVPDATRTITAMRFVR